MSPLVPPPVEEWQTEFNSNASIIIQTLMVLKSQNLENLAALTGMSRATMYNRINGRHPWQGWELHHLAQVLDADIGVFGRPARELLNDELASRSGHIIAGDREDVPAKVVALDAGTETERASGRRHHPAARTQRGRPAQPARAS